MTTAANRKLFETMLTALGTKDFDTFEACLTEDILFEWPFAVMEGFPHERRGARWFRESLEASWQDFAPYNYRIETVHDLASPDQIIAEYSSHSIYLPTGEPYSNKYISVLDFADGRITRWREYLNPQVIARVVGASAVWTDTGGAKTA
jgi:ketosteroid isomerase-like protein